MVSIKLWLLQTFGGLVLHFSIPFRFWWSCYRLFAWIFLDSTSLAMLVGGYKYIIKCRCSSMDWILT